MGGDQKTELELIVQCLGCHLVTLKRDFWVSPVCFPQYEAYRIAGKISHGYCLTCGESYAEQQGIPLDLYRKYRDGGKVRETHESQE